MCGSSRVLSIHNRSKQKKLLGEKRKRTEKRTRKAKESDKKEKKTQSKGKRTKKKIEERYLFF